VAVPRFQLLPASRVQPRQVWVDGVPTQARTAEDGSVVWRLLGANNYELGRSAESFPGIEAAHAAIDDFVRRLPDLVDELDATATSGRWRWRLLSGTDLLATSSRSFQRERECRYNLAQFIAHALDAQPPWHDDHPAAQTDLAAPTSVVAR
jgi:hypothetical protein